MSRTTSVANALEGLLGASGLNVGNAMRGDASVSAGLDLVIGGVGYKLSSAEDALSIYQLGYAAGPKNAALYFYMFQNTDFHTFVLPEGEYPLDREVWTYKDDRAYVSRD